MAPGLTFLDETMLAVVAGQLYAHSDGVDVLQRDRSLSGLYRAPPRPRVDNRDCRAGLSATEMVAFTGMCLVHRAEIIQFHGAWPEALAEACGRRVRALPTVLRPSRPARRSTNGPRSIACGENPRKPMRRIGTRAGSDSGPTRAGPAAAGARTYVDHIAAIRRLLDQD